MKILFIVPNYPRDASDYVGKFFRDQAKALHRAGHHVGVIVAPFLRGKRLLQRISSFSELRTQYKGEEDAGIPVRRAVGWGWFPGFMPGANLELKVHITKVLFQQYCQLFGAPTVVHAQTCLPAGYLAARVLEGKKQPLVITEHSSLFIQDKIPLFMKQPVHFALEHAQQVFAVGQALASKLEPIVPGLAVRVLGNIVEPSFLETKLESLPSSPFTFCMVGALIPRKRVDMLLQAFTKAFSEQQVRLAIGGDGPERAGLEALSLNLGIADQVQFLGRLDSVGVRHLFQTSHVLVSTSDQETFGITVAEAMACGRPVIATRSGGPQDFITEQVGLLVPVGDIEALSNAMHRLKTHYVQYNPQTIRKICQEQFSEPVIVQRLEDTYRKLAEEAGTI